ncbi:hypothetical protein BD779DRAFT_291497 [Infundibulicybe gibba]|nr:hypothetical protein BD779DRAFT_291497 [Infundibulicybe gibba]
MTVVERCRDRRAEPLPPLMRTCVMLFGILGWTVINFIGAFVLINLISFNPARARQQLSRHSRLILSMSCHQRSLLFKLCTCLYWPPLIIWLSRSVVEAGERSYHTRQCMVRGGVRHNTSIQLLTGRVATGHCFSSPSRITAPRDLIEVDITVQGYISSTGDVC